MTESTTQAAENEMMVHQNDTNGKKFSRRVTSEENPKITQKALRKNQHNLAQLVSELNREKQLYAKRPRINYIDTLSAKSVVEAKYIKDWVQKIEIIGNINYPNQAKQKKLSGILILSALVNHDGSVISSTVQQKSKEKLLNDAAIKVVRLAAPYKQFPPEMREQYDQLMITRAWVYHSDNKLSAE